MSEIKLKKKYGLFTAISMVVGIVMGSGIFFKAQKILEVSEGSLPVSIFAWLIGGLIMLVCAYAFSGLAARYEKVNGIVDYAEAIVGPRYAYLLNWFMLTIYYPSMTSVLAWLSANYLCSLFGAAADSGACLALSCFFLCGSYAVNALSPKIAGKLQVSTTVIKLIPLVAVGVIGTVMGLLNGTIAQNFSSAAYSADFSAGGALFTSVCATAFAYEGWIIATTINAELRDAKRTLPKALLGGSLIVVGVYILYNVGLFGVVDKSVIYQNGTTPAFTRLFGSVGGTLVSVLVVISCLGTLNGLMLACTRGLYSIAARDLGPKPQIFRQVDAATNMPNNSAVVALVLCAFWMLYYFGAELAGTPWFGFFSFDSSELPIITIYGGYLPIFVFTMLRGKDMHPFRRYGVSAAAILCCLFMMLAAVVAHGITVVGYLCLFAVVMAIGAFFGKKRPGAKESPIPKDAV